ncbi:MAG: cytochrome c [Myxococcales bacterium]|nr:cytochrome c [Myxococcales bacterium]USN50233.1 MAG: cytochrome c [Myxococcales bacterium]
MKKFLVFAPLLLLILLEVGCRGYTTDKPPIHVNPNMDTQEKGRPYRESDFFQDGTYMRAPIEGTVARGALKEDEHFYFGKINGQFARSLPKNLVIDEKFLQRGQRVFNRTCAACHADIGDGDGLVGRRLTVKPTSLHSDYMYGLAPGHYFDVITNGIRTMQSYKHMINENDRWAVVTYIRSLQISQDVNGQWIERSASWWKQP